MVCLALELVGPCVVLDFSVGMEAFDELLSINVPRSKLWEMVKDRKAWLAVVQRVATSQTGMSD